MKKYFVLAAVLFGTMAMTSCKKNCCTWNGVEVCEDDLPAGYADWDAYKAAVEAGGGNCD
jgi:hypothetical protein